MDTLMSLTIIEPSKRLSAIRAGKRPLAKVTPHVSLQVDIPRKTLPAHLARKLGRFDPPAHLYEGCLPVNLFWVVRPNVPFLVLIG